MTDSNIKMSRDGFGMFALRFTPLPFGVLVFRMQNDIVVKYSTNSS